nr:SufBD protein [uncultured Oscillibacter sp.]
MDIIAGLKSKRNVDAYQLLLMLERESAESNVLYDCFEEFIGLLKSESSFVRVRGFRLACAQARWDVEHKIEKNFDTLLIMLDDEKPAAVRQCLAALRTVLSCKPDLAGRLAEKLRAMDLSKYPDSMAPLLRKDIEEMRTLL